MTSVAIAGHTKNESVIDFHLPVEDGSMKQLWRSWCNVDRESLDGDGG